MVSTLFVEAPSGIHFGGKEAAVHNRLVASLRANGFFDKWAAVQGALVGLLGRVAKTRGVKTMRMTARGPAAMKLPKGTPGMYELPQSKAMARIMNPVGSTRQVMSNKVPTAALERLEAKFANVGSDTMKMMTKGLSPSRKQVSIQPIKPPKPEKAGVTKRDLIKGLKPVKIGSVDSWLLDGFSGSIEKWAGNREGKAA